MRKVLLGLIEFGAIGAMFNSVLPETNQEANAADDGTTQVARASAGGVRAPADVAASAAVAGRSPATRLAECDTPSPRVNTDTYRFLFKVGSYGFYLMPAEMVRAKHCSANFYREYCQARSKDIQSIMAYWSIVQSRLKRRGRSGSSAKAPDAAMEVPSRRGLRAVDRDLSDTE
jgi:hypothetical protein